MCVCVCECMCVYMITNHFGFHYKTTTDKRKLEQNYKTEIRACMHDGGVGLVKVSEAR